MSSKYDELGGRYYAARSKKPGTVYEQLVAAVQKVLDGQADVTHDVRLVGASGVKHQIDITVVGPGGTRRTLIECKDLQGKRKKVGLGLVRDFVSVVRDIEPDDAIVVTCTGFTRNAQKFAKHNQVKLKILRAVETSENKMGFSVHTHWTFRLDGRTILEADQIIDLGKQIAVLVLRELGAEQDVIVGDRDLNRVSFECSTGRVVWSDEE